jgi:hypothetical protein
MNEHRIRADSFVLKKQRIRIYRIRHRDSATVYWIKSDDALRYLQRFRTLR